MLHQNCFLRFNISKPRQLFAAAQTFFLKTGKKRISVRSYEINNSHYFKLFLKDQNLVYLNYAQSISLLKRGIIRPIVHNWI